MTDLQQAAEIYWRLINEQPVSRDDYIFCIKVAWGEHKGSPFYSLTSDLPEVILSPINEQPKLAAVTERWRKHLKAPTEISDQQAIYFITELYAALENVEPHIKKRVAPGVTRCTRNTVSDFVTRRPNVKLGWTIQLTTEGQGHYNCIRNQLVTQPGDLILLSPDALYDYQRNESNESNETWEHHWAYFLLQDDWLDLLQWPEVGPNIYHLRCEGETLEKLQRLFDDLLNARFDDQPLSERLSASILEQILIRCQQLAPENTTPKVDRRIIDAKEYITKNYNKSFSVAALAKDIGLSVARLSSLFKAHTGTTIVRWRDEHRMTRATQLLIQTDQPVSRIADMVGYNDALYFSRCFHQQTGCSPVEYRSRKNPSHLPEDETETDSQAL
jgi:AraC family transcriptional regulator, arabinose operon regulatory protein